MGRQVTIMRNHVKGIFFKFFIGGLLLASSLKSFHSLIVDGKKLFAYLSVLIGEMQCPCFEVSCLFHCVLGYEETGTKGQIHL